MRRVVHQITALLALTAAVPHVLAAQKQATRPEAPPDSSLLAAAAAAVATLDSSERADSAAKAEFLTKLMRRSGLIALEGGMAKIDLPATLSFLDHDGAKLLLENGWGNPPGAADDVIGMIIPNDVDPLGEDSWGIVIEFNDDGYVSDTDAAEMDFNKMLKDMQEATEESNKMRAEDGYETVKLLGWAESPKYDAQTHKIFWAKELAFEGNEENTLNYAVRILGRRGVLELNAVASMSSLDAIRSEVAALLPAVEFNEGHRYTDYVEGSDKVATYGLMGLVAGAVATKAGFFKVLFAALVAGKKFVVIGLVAAAAAAKKFLGKKSAA
ncbi:MAG: DUF2167 domain-containing protein [Gemmatimonadaceae bacterium]